MREELRRFGEDREQAAMKLRGQGWSQPSRPWLEPAVSHPSAMGRWRHWGAVVQMRWIDGQRRKLRYPQCDPDQQYPSRS